MKGRQNLLLAELCCEIRRFGLFLWEEVSKLIVIMVEKIATSRVLFTLEIVFVNFALKKLYISEKKIGL